MDKDSTCQWKAIAVYEGKWNVTSVYITYPIVLQSYIHLWQLEIINYHHDHPSSEN